MRQEKKIDKYAQIESFYHDSRIQVYMYAFVYVDPETMVEKEYFKATKRFVQDYNRRSTPGIFPKH